MCHSTVPPRAPRYGSVIAKAGVGKRSPASVTAVPGRSPRTTPPPGRRDRDSLPLPGPTRVRLAVVDVSARARRRAARARVGVIVGATQESDPFADWYGSQQVQDPVDFPAPSARPAVESVVSHSQGVVAYPGRGGLSEDASADPATGELPIAPPEHITETTCRIPVISSADLTGPIPRVAGELFTSEDSAAPAASLTPASGFWTAT